MTVKIFLKEANSHAQKVFIILAMAVVWLAVAGETALSAEGQQVLFTDEFASLRPGYLFGVNGALGEYQYLPVFDPKGPWGVTGWRSDAASQLAWRVEKHNDQPVLMQTYANKERFCHPIVVGGDDSWKDYTVAVQFAPQAGKGESGVLFRYLDARCYYFFGVEGSEAVLKMVRNAHAYHKPFEKILARQKFGWTSNQDLLAQITVSGSHIEARLADAANLSDGVVLSGNDTNYLQGRIGLVSDFPTRFDTVRVTATSDEVERVTAEQKKREADTLASEARLPKMVLWKKISTPGFGTGHNIRFGDLNGDGQMDVLFCQVANHGPKDQNSEVSCLTAMTLDGKMLWQVGKADEWHDKLTSDVAFQIYDLYGTGHNDIIYCMNQKLIVADGATGKTIAEVPTPLTPPGEDGHLGDAHVGDWNSGPNIYGDAIYFADFSGRGRRTDIVLKDRYRHFWVYSDHLKLLWKGECDTGHYPWASDVDGKGRDNLFIGYSCYDHNGNQLWSLDKNPEMFQHADAVAFLNFFPGTVAPPRELICASDDGVLFVDARGNILKHYYVGHAQSPAVAKFLTDVPGLQTIVMTYWGDQGIAHLFDADGNMIKEWEMLCHNGSMCSPVNWTGEQPEYWLFNASVKYGGLYDGLGQCVLRFPADGHPDMCSAVLDLNGDCRDEIVVWDPYELWIYTQSDNPKSGRLYKPKRNPLYNWSNYQTTISLPGWSDEKP